MCDKKDIQGILSGLQSMKSNPMTPDNVADVLREYHEVLGDIDACTLQIAAQSYKAKNTWFPTAGDLRKEVASLKSLAYGIPTPAEAWAEVLAPEKYIEPVFCDDGARLRSAAENAAPADYWRTNSEYDQHRKKCDICKDGGLRKVYSHPAVKNTVHRLGGVDAILTTPEMKAADRSQFIRAYNDIVEREKEKAMMSPDVASFVMQEQKAVASSTQNKIGLLAENWSVR